MSVKLRGQGSSFRHHSRPFLRNQRVIQPVPYVTGRYVYKSDTECGHLKAVQFTVIYLHCISSEMCGFLKVKLWITNTSSTVPFHRDLDLVTPYFSCRGLRPSQPDTEAMLPSNRHPRHSVSEKSRLPGYLFSRHVIPGRHVVCRGGLAGRLTYLHSAPC